MEGQYSIFIIGGDNRERHGLALSLEHAGCQVTATASAHQGLRKARKADFDLIIMDQHLPDMDGMALLPLVRQAHPSAPILVLATRDRPGLAEKLCQKGAQGYLPKPVNPACVLSQVRTLLIQKLVQDAEARADSAKAWATPAWRITASRRQAMPHPLEEKTL